MQVINFCISEETGLCSQPLGKIPSWKPALASQHGGFVPVFPQISAFQVRYLCVGATW